MTDSLGQSQVIPYVIGLTGKGYDLAIMSYEKNEKFKRYGKDVKKNLIVNSVAWKPFRYHKRFNVLSTTYDVICGILYLIYYIPANKIKILHCRSYIASILGLIFKKIYGTKFIFDMRGFWANERLEGGIFKNNYLYIFFKYLEKQFIKYADATIALTVNSIDEMKTWPFVTEKESLNFYHIPTCCDIDKFACTFDLKLQRKADFQQLNFVYVGSIGPWHSFDEISAFIRCAYKYLPLSRFKIVVSAGKEEILHFINSENLDKNRIDVVSVQHQDIPSVFINADIGFFFIPPVYGKKSSSPTKLGEMLASGIPVITGHSVGDVDKLIINNKIGYVIKEFTEAEYRNAIDSLIDLIKKDGDELAKRCLRVANEYFCLKKGVNSYAKIYQKITNE